MVLGAVLLLQMRGFRSDHCTHGQDASGA